MSVSTAGHRGIFDGVERAVREVLRTGQPVLLSRGVIEGVDKRWDDLGWKLLLYGIDRYLSIPTTSIQRFIFEASTTLRKIQDAPANGKLAVFCRIVNQNGWSQLELILAPSDYLLAAA